MALSNDDLWRVIDAVPGGEELGDGGAWLLSVLRAIEAEVRKQDAELIQKLVEALENIRDHGLSWDAAFDAPVRAVRARLEGMP